MFKKKRKITHMKYILEKNDGTHGAGGLYQLYDGCVI